MTWDERGFSKLRRVSGAITLSMMGQSMQVPYEANVYMDSASTVGAIEAEGPQGTNWLFVSLTDSGATYTQPSPRPGDMDFEGDRLVATPAQDRDGILAAHLGAIGDGAKSDADALDTALEAAPQNAVNLAGEAMKRLAAGLVGLS